MGAWADARRGYRPGEAAVAASSRAHILQKSLHRTLIILTMIMVALRSRAKERGMSEITPSPPPRRRGRAFYEDSV